MSGHIGFGGGCHWCTEAIFQALRGVGRVEQGFIKSEEPDDAFSEAVLVEFDKGLIPQEVLIQIHLRTHASTSEHKMRHKYRSAVYTFNQVQNSKVRKTLFDLQPEFDAKLVTRVLEMVEFKPSPERYQNYHANDPDRPFCQTHIDPKLAFLRSKYREFYNAKSCVSG